MTTKELFSHLIGTLQSYNILQSDTPAHALARDEAIDAWFTEIEELKPMNMPDGDEFYVSRKDAPEQGGGQILRFIYQSESNDIDIEINARVYGPTPQLIGMTENVTGS